MPSHTEDGCLGRHIDDPRRLVARSRCQEKVIRRECQIEDGIIMRSKAEVRLGEGSFRASISVKKPYTAFFISDRHQSVCYYGQLRWTLAGKEGGLTVTTGCTKGYRQLRLRWCDIDTRMTVFRPCEEIRCLMLPF